MTTSTTPDPILAAYASGDYSTALQDIQNAGMTAQDVIDKYNLNADQAAQVAQNLGYTGSLSGDTFGSGYVAPSSAPAANVGAQAINSGNTVTGNMDNVDTYSNLTTDVNGNTIPLTYGVQSAGTTSNQPSTIQPSFTGLESGAYVSPNANGASNVQQLIKAYQQGDYLAQNLLQNLGFNVGYASGPQFTKATPTDIINQINQNNLGSATDAQIAAKLNIPVSDVTAARADVNAIYDPNTIAQQINSQNLFGANLNAAQNKYKVTQQQTLFADPYAQYATIVPNAGTDATTGYNDKLNNILMTMAGGNVSNIPAALSQLQQSYASQQKSNATPTGIYGQYLQMLNDPTYATGYKNASRIVADTSLMPQFDASAGNQGGSPAHSNTGVNAATSGTTGSTTTATPAVSQNETNFLNQIKSLTSDPTSINASGIQNLISMASSDPTLSTKYASQIQALQSVLPGYQAQDAITQAQSGTNVLQNYQQLVNLAQNSPAVASALGSNTISGIQAALGESGGGKYISTFEALTGLDKSLTSQAASQLPTTTQTVPQYDENGVRQNVTTTVVDPSKLAAQGIYAVDDGNGNTIYQQQIKTPPGWDTNTKVFATYDSNGKLTGFSSPNPVFPTDANGNMSKVKYDASWTASGAPTPQLDTSHGGFLSNALQSMGPLGGLAIGAGISALTGGIASPLSDALTGMLGQTLGTAATQGVITGGLSSLLGGKFATGFETGALGSGITQGLNAIPGMPATASQYYTKPVGNALASSLVNNTPVGTNLANAAISGGLNQSLNNIPGLDAKSAGIIASLLPSLISGKINPASLVGVASNLGKATT